MKGIGGSWPGQIYFLPSDTIPFEDFPDIFLRPKITLTITITTGEDHIEVTQKEWVVTRFFENSIIKRMLK